MRKVGILSGIVGAAVMGVLFFANSGEIHARAQYKKAFEKKYPGVKENNTVNCNTCHEGTNKKMRNDYGKALQEIFGSDKNVKDAKKIEEVLVKTAEKQKKFGERLKANKLPVE